jgi:hypothetical protein
LAADVVTQSLAEVKAAAAKAAADQEAARKAAEATELAKAVEKAGLDNESFITLLHGCNYKFGDSNPEYSHQTSA